MSKDSCLFLSTLYIGFLPSLSLCPLPCGGFLMSPPKGVTCNGVPYLSSSALKEPKQRWYVLGGTVLGNFHGLSHLKIIIVLEAGTVSTPIL